tara:strand:+ start:320 stop:565 length:246 start_codon:yes stop_codon:yes gene_type:complete
MNFFFIFDNNFNGAIGEVYICKQFSTSPIHFKFKSHGLTVVFTRFYLLITWEYHVKYVVNPIHNEEGVSNFELKNWEVPIT